MLEMYTIISEISDNVNLVIGVQNIVELEAELGIREYKFKFKQISSYIPCTLKRVKPKERMF